MARKPSKVEEVGLDMTPMIDCCFQLIVFFCLVNDFSNLEAVDLVLPRADESSMVIHPERLIVNVRSDGNVRILGTTYGDQALGDLFRSVARQNPSPEDSLRSDVVVYVRGDAEAAYVHVQKVMVLAQQAGLWKIAFGAEKQPAS